MSIIPGLASLPFLKEMYIDHAKFLERLHCKVVCEGEQSVWVGEASGQAVLLVLHSQSQGVHQGEVGWKLISVIAKIGQELLQTKLLFLLSQVSLSIFTWKTAAAS